MSVNDLLFGVLPYVVAVLAIVVTVVRWKRHPFSVTSLSSQLLESKQLYWGTLSFHWGLSLILLAHLAALIVPSWFELWNGAPLRLYLLEITGLALGLWAGLGLLILVYRRLTNRRILRVTTPMDLVVLLTIGVQIFSGVTIAIAYRWGSYWGTAVAVPYVRSLLVFQPDPDLIGPLPFLVKTHIVSFFVFLALFPFTRLVHIITLPLQYFFRSWQQVIGMRYRPSHKHRPPRLLGGSSIPKQGIR
jgi:nitrate reductase gamma subunit